jgi:hypothetical protein
MKNRKSRNSTILLLGLLLGVVVSGGLSGCSEDQAVLLLPKPAMMPYVDDPFAETGIRATPDAGASDSVSNGGILVEWRAIDPSKVSGVRVGGYYLYRAQSRSETDLSENPKFVRYKKIESPTGADTIFIDEAIEQGYIYSYYVTSYNKSDVSQESDPSDTVHYQPSARPILQQPIAEVEAPADGNWEFFFGPADQFFGTMAIEVNEVDLSNERILLGRMWRSSNEYVEGPSGTIYYRGAKLQSGRRYRWRVIKPFPLIVTPGSRIIPTGNTSKWQTFTVR